MSEQWIEVKSDDGLAGSVGRVHAVYPSACGEDEDLLVVDFARRVEVLRRKDVCETEERVDVLAREMRGLCVVCKMRMALELYHHRGLLCRRCCPKIVCPTARRAGECPCGLDDLLRLYNAPMLLVEVAEVLGGAVDWRAVRGWLASHPKFVEHSREIVSHMTHARRRGSCEGGLESDQCTSGDELFLPVHET